MPRDKKAELRAFGQKLLDMRLALHVSQTGLGGLLDVDPRQISRYETGASEMGALLYDRILTLYEQTAGPGEQASGPDEQASEPDEQAAEQGEQPSGPDEQGSGPAGPAREEGAEYLVARWSALSEENRRLALALIEALPAERRS